MNCPYCLHKKTYFLKNNYYKCAKCTTKFSKSKYEKDLLIIKLFCNNLTALQVSKRLKISYKTVLDRFVVFRKLISLYLEDLYSKTADETAAYEEYYYFFKKRKIDIINSINIIGFYSNKKVFTLLLPKVDKNIDNNVYQKYLTWNKIYSKEAYKTPLSIFWKFIEEYLKKYKGIEQKNFFFYLKECEFKFNFLQNKQIEILQSIYFKKD